MIAKILLLLGLFCTNTIAGAALVIKVEKPVVIAEYNTSTDLKCIYPVADRSNGLFIYVKWEDQDNKVIATLDLENDPEPKPTITAPFKDKVEYIKPATIRFRNVKFTDEGTYKCTVDFAQSIDPDKEPKGTDQAEAKLVVYKPPVVVVEGEKIFDESVDTGEAANVTCTARGARPKAVLDWERTSEGDATVKMRDAESEEVDSTLKLFDTKQTVTVTSGKMDSVISCMVNYTYGEKTEKITIMMNKEANKPLAPSTITAIVVCLVLFICGILGLIVLVNRRMSTAGSTRPNRNTNGYADESIGKAIYVIGEQ